jgi:hypothetical protein
MSISHIVAAIKASKGRDVLLVGIVAGASLAGYGLGRVSVLEAMPVAVQEPGEASVGQVGPLSSSAQESDTGLGKGVGVGPAAGVVASKNGTKYYPPWCAGAKRISETNKMQFASAEAAKKAGYAPAANCKGL